MDEQKLIYWISVNNKIIYIGKGNNKRVLNHFQLSYANKQPINDYLLSKDPIHINYGYFTLNQLEKYAIKFHCPKFNFKHNKKTTKF